MEKICFENFGFTLVEMLTVTAIIIVITALVAANYHRGNKQIILNNQAAQFAQDLRRVQEWALSARQIGGASQPGYGIYIAAGGNSYILYADRNGNNIYDPAAVPAEAQETVVLNSNIEILSCAPASASINYISPDLTAKINNIATPELKVIFRYKNDTITRTAVANIAGLVYVQ